MSVPCPYCQHDAALLFRVGDLNRHVTDELFSYYHCPNCGLIFEAPIPANLGQYYISSYYAFPATPEAFAQEAEPQRYKIDLIRSFKPQGKLLEIGSSIGAFAYLAKQAGYATEVIEMDKACCDFIEQTLGIPASNSADAAEVLKDRGQYDVIAMWQVIEHLPDPWALLPVLVRHLAPGGILVIATPNPESLEFRLLRRWWPHVDAPRHLELIPIPLLEQALNQQGLKRIHATTSDSGVFIHNTFGWKMGFHHLMPIASLKRPARAAGVATAWALAPLERRGLRGSTYTLVFRKND